MQPPAPQGGSRGNSGDGSPEGRNIQTADNSHGQRSRSGGN